MPEDLVIDALRAAPGTKATGYVVVDESAGGVVIRVPVILLNGAEDGPTLVVTSGVHGNDLNTVPMVWRVAETVDPGQLRGRVIAVPVCNPPAFEAGTHLTPGDNASPSFPGDPHGTISQRIGHGLHEKIVVLADYLLDMHGGSVRSTLAALAGFDDGAPDDVRKQAKAMAEAFNPDLVITMKPKGAAPPTGMFQAASRRGAPGLIIGMGQMGFTEKDTERGARGVTNVMKHLDMLEGEVARTVEPKHTDAETYHYTPYGGGFFPQVDVAEEVVRGQVLGVVHNVFGERVGEVSSEVSGMVVGIRFYPVVGAGEWVASVASW